LKKQVRQATIKPPTASNRRMVVNNSAEVHKIKIEVNKFNLSDI
jgi:hypothetical protein